MKKKNKKYLLALNRHPDIGPSRLKQIFDKLDDFKVLFTSTLLTRFFEPKLVQIIREAREKINPEKEWGILERLGVETVFIDEKNYPSLLKEIPDPPIVLYCRGSLKSLALPTIAVVGSRKMSEYGRQATEKIVSDLAKSGVTIVSGLALGIDSVAHRATLKAGGQTVAILGCGLDQVYPHSHKGLAEEIIKKEGAIISEFAPGFPSYPSNFPQRNRIIAGLSLATIIIEAAESSGALITAAAALEYNREVMAVPGDIFRPTSQGTNNLIKMGAKLVTEAQEVLTELNLPSKLRKLAEIPLSTEEEMIFKELSFDPLSINELAKRLNLEIAKISATLTLMEIKGRVKNLGGNQFVRTG